MALKLKCYFKRYEKVHAPNFTSAKRLRAGGKEMNKIGASSLRKKSSILLLAATALIAAMALLPVPVAAQEEAATQANIYIPIGAALAVGLAGIGAGIAVGFAGASGLSALTEKPEVFSSVLLVVALGEGIAIYGLIIALLLLIG